MAMAFGCRGRSRQGPGRLKEMKVLQQQLHPLLLLLLLLLRLMQSMTVYLSVRAVGIRARAMASAPPLHSPGLPLSCESTATAAAATCNRRRR